MDSLTSTIYINYLLNDSNVSLIEVWDNKLFVWRYKGRPTFTTTLGLVFELPLYYRINEYKKLSKNYHPDLSMSKSPRVLSGSIQASINDVREALEIQNRGYDAGHYSKWYAEFDRALTCKIASTRSELTRELSTRLYDYSNMVQDKFTRQENEITTFLQEVFKTGVSGKSIKEVMWERGASVRERTRQAEIRGLNRAGLSKKAEKNNLTNYGESSREHQIYLRTTYGDVFSVYVGGEIDTSPLQKRKYRRRDSKENV